MDKEYGIKFLNLLFGSGKHADSNPAQIRRLQKKFSSGCQPPELSVPDHKVDTGSVPEALSHSLDIFQLGVLLFQLATGTNPFNCSTEQDKQYQHIISCNYAKYWGSFKQIPPLTQEFRELFVQLVAYEPKQRPTWKQILSSAWLKPIEQLSLEEVAKCSREKLQQLLPQVIIKKNE